MQKTIVALFDNREDAQKAVGDLVNHGIDRQQISLVTRTSDGKNMPMRSETTPTSHPVQKEEPAPGKEQPSAADSEARAGAGIGAILGGVGGILVGLGALAIPGIGPVLAAGPLAAALGGVAGAGTGAIAGGAAGGLVGALTDVGIPKETAGYYAEGVTRGGTLITVRPAETMLDQTKNILDQHHPVDMNERATQWRQTGWSGFQPQTEPREEPFVHDTGTGQEQKEDQRLGDTFGQPMGIDAERMRTGGMSPQGTQPQGTMPAQSFDTMESGFRDHYVNNFSDRGYGYNGYMPAYRYGYDLANNERYTNMDWSQIEPDARRYWEERHPGTWADFRDAIYYAWTQTHKPGM